MLAVERTWVLGFIFSSFARASRVQRTVSWCFDECVPGDREASWRHLMGLAGRVAERARWTGKRRQRHRGRAAERHTPRSRVAAILRTQNGIEVGKNLDFRAGRGDDLLYNVRY